MARHATIFLTSELLSGFIETAPEPVFIRQGGV